ncbi:FAD-linked oxidase OS=Lysinibacillus sphaericus OX=1421 GN=LS41612_09665 PE=4 SV=1 [Lysinibacillus sphaericus]
MQKYHGRPHWGKQSHLTAQQVHTLYPNIDKFLTVRAQYDPDKVFFTRYLEQLFIL